MAVCSIFAVMCTNGMAFKGPTQRDIGLRSLRTQGQYR